MEKFTAKDIEQIKKHGLKISEVEQQISDFESGFPYMNITEPATVDNGGIRRLSEEEINSFITFYDNNTVNYNICKFVPASGAATRMFKDLYEYLATETENPTTNAVLNNLTEFAFYEDLKESLPEHPDSKTIISEITKKYGNLPKALIPFHKYDNLRLTALEEHLTEGAQYARSQDKVRIHFTVSPEHKNDFQNLLNQVLGKYEKAFDTKYEIKMSKQKSSTDTIAVNPDNSVFREEDGSLLFRPAGHGALIENLNDLDADIVFIKNIDNVCPASQRANTVKYKKALAGLLEDLQIQTHKYLREWSDNPEHINEVKNFLTQQLQQRDIPSNATSDYYRKILNRPIRVCGMVKNTGAPGGGPFWTKTADGSISLQIVESSQIAPESRDIMNQSSHFNPVDLVCFIKDYEGNKFNLTDFVDPATGFISEKSKSGKILKAMERPGLWNGAMSNWNTVFVEVPADTFTPVKVVSDLIKPQHQNK